MQQSLVLTLVLGLCAAVPVAAAEGVPATASSGQSMPVAFAGDATDPATFVEGQVLVKYRPNRTSSAKAAARTTVGALAVQPVSSRATDVELVELPEGISVAAAVEALRTNPDVAIVQPNYRYELLATSNDPRYTDGTMWNMYGDQSSPSNQYGSQAGEAWAAGYTGSSDVYVVVIDDGLDVTHPDLAGNVWTNPFEVAGNGVDDDGNGYVDDLHGWDFIDNDNDVVAPGESHGTHVAGTIGAVGGNGVGVAGVAWDVTLIAARAIGDGGTSLSIALALLYAAELKVRHGLNVIATNNSYGLVDGSGNNATSDPLMEDLIEFGGDVGILFIAAAGNGGPDLIGDDNDVSPTFPASYPCTRGGQRSWDCVVSVAAIGPDGSKAGFSNFGATSVDLAAPGFSIRSTADRTDVPSGYVSFSGTSMAAPHVTGALALCAAANRGIGAEALRSRLLSTTIATPAMASKSVTGGRLDASALAGSCAALPPGSYTCAASSYSWVDAVSGGTQHALGNDGSVSVPLGFAFPFYGVGYSSTWVSANGLLGFGERPLPSSISGANMTVPSAAHPNGGVYAFWDDLDLRTSGAVWTKVIGAAPNRTFVASWVNVPHFVSSGATGGVTFQALLSELTGTITFQYQDTSFGDSRFDSGVSATVGIEAPSGLTGNLVSFDTSSVSSLTAVSCSPSWRTIGPTTKQWGLVDYSSSVALSADGSRLVIGSPTVAPCSTGYPTYCERHGAVRVFERTREGWVQLGETMSCYNGRATSGVGCGTSVDISGDGTRVVVGAPSYSVWDTRAGAYFVFDLVGLQWQQSGPARTGSDPNEYLGRVVTISRDGSTIAAVSSPTNVNENPNRYVRIEGPVHGDIPLFGMFHQISSIALSGDGGFLGVASGNEFQLYSSNSGSWQQVGGRITLGSTAGISSIDLSDDGSRVALGQAYADGNQGIVELFDRSPVTGLWGETPTRMNGQPDGTSFGLSVSISGNGRRIAVGSLGPSQPRTEVFAEGPLGWAKVGQTLQAASGTTNVGGAVALASAAPTIALTGHATIGVYGEPAIGPSNSALPRIAGSAIPAMVRGTPVSTTLSTDEGSAPFAWELASGQLPPGVSISGAGLLSGTPTASGTYAAVFRSTDALARSDYRQFDFPVARVLEITTSSLPGAVQGVPYSGAQLTSFDGEAPVTWRVTSGALPTGMSLSTSGLLSGTPTSSGTYSITVAATDAGSRSAERGLQLTVTGTALSISQTSLPQATRFASYAQTLTATGSSGGTSWAVVAGSLPPGLGLSTGGLLSGSPTVAGTFPLTIRVTDGAGRTADRVFALTVVLEGTEASRYINAAFQLFTGRPATTGEIATWSPTVQAGNRYPLTSALAVSDGWAGYEIDQLYQIVLGRGADPSGRAYWVSQVAAGVRLETIATFYYGGPEYYTANGNTPAGYVTALYQDILHRQPDQSGLNFWVGMLNSGALDRYGVAANFYASIESRRDRVNRLYQRILGRGPDTDGWNYWAGQLLTTGDVTLAVLLAGSDEYYIRATR